MVSPLREAVHEAVKSLLAMRPAVVGTFPDRASIEAVNDDLTQLPHILDKLVEAYGTVLAQNVVGFDADQVLAARALVDEAFVTLRAEIAKKIENMPQPRAARPYRPLVLVGGGR